jgi:hypothetical protein
MRALSILVGSALLALLLATPVPADPNGYSFLGTLRGGLQATPVTMSIEQAEIPNPQSHAAVWEMAVDNRGSWLSAGLIVDATTAEPVVFVETGIKGDRQTSVRYLGQLAYGTEATIRLTTSPRHGWVVWYDGRAVGSERLGPFTQRMASGELYGGASMRFHLQETPAASLTGQ